MQEYRCNMMLAGKLSWDDLTRSWRVCYSCPITWTLRWGELGAVNCAEVLSVFPHMFIRSVLLKELRICSTDNMELFKKCFIYLIYKANLICATFFHISLTVQHQYLTLFLKGSWNESKETSLPHRQSIHASTLSGKSVQRMRATFIIVNGKTRTTDCCNIFYVYITMGKGKGKGKVGSPRDEAPLPDATRGLGDFFNF